MKAFWGVILVLAVVAGVLLARNEGSGAAPASADLGALEAEPPRARVDEAPMAEDAEALTEVGEGDRQLSDATAGNSGQRSTGEGNGEGESQPANDPAPADPIARDAVAEADASAAAGTPAHDAQAAARAREAAELAEAAREAESADAAATEGPSILLDEKWRVPGEGTAASPYVVPWDVLVSAGREYNPLAGRTELPAWAAQLDGKHVRLSGFLLFPIVASDADELLVMYNQWDGCCLGIPPTPYDSIEVKLAEPTSKDAWRFTYGSVTGVLRVDPYVSGKWLISLYVLEEAKLEATGL